MSRPHPHPRTAQPRPAPAVPPVAAEGQGRRQHARLDVRMSAEIRTTRAVFTATTRDLSEAGAGLEEAPEDYNPLGLTVVP